MNILLTAFDRRNGVNPMVRRLLEPLEREHSIRSSMTDDIDLVVVAFIAAPEHFELQAGLLAEVQRRQLPVIILDYTETMPSNFILGSPGQVISGSNPYSLLHEMMASCPVKAYFKRELWKAHRVVANCAVYPIDWVVRSGDPKLETNETEEQYHKRPIDIFMSWGYSSEDRPKFHGELLKQAGRFNAHFCLTEEDLDRALVEGRQRIFALLHTPHYRRIHIDKLLQWQKQSKVSVSLRGAGYKCFRHAEASYNTVMACQDPTAVKWSYEWHAGNCIALPNSPGSPDFLNAELSVDWLFQCLRVSQGDLYPLLQRGIQNNKNYRLENYTHNYLWPEILGAIK